MSTRQHYTSATLPTQYQFLREVYGNFFQQAGWHILARLDACANVIITFLIHMQWNFNLQLTLSLIDFLYWIYTETKLGLKFHKKFRYNGVSSLITKITILFSKICREWDILCRNVAVVSAYQKATTVLIGDVLSDPSVSDANRDRPNLQKSPTKARTLAANRNGPQ